MERKESCRLPSGATVDFRPLKLKELDAVGVATQKGVGLREMSRITIDLISSCTVAVVDPGPYSFLQIGEKPEWKKMLSGDRVGAMLHLRKISYREGDKFTIYDAQCPECGKKTDFEIDIDADIFRRDLDEDGAELLREGKAIETEIAGRVVHHSFGTGETDELMQRLMEQYPENPLACGLRAKIVSVSDLDNRDIMKWMLGDGDHDGLTAGDVSDLRDAMEEAECGFDTTIAVECDGALCGAEYEVELPFQWMFARPSRRRRRNRRRDGSD